MKEQNMIELTPTTGKAVTMPNVVERYTVVYWTTASGWELYSSQLFTNPESVLASFLTFASTYETNNAWKPRFYKVVKFDLELPFVGENVSL